MSSNIETHNFYKVIGISSRNLLNVFDDPMLYKGLFRESMVNKLGFAPIIL